AIADHLSYHFRVRKLFGGPRTLQQGYEVRRHLPLASLYHATHAGQIGIASDDGPEMGKRILPAWIGALDRAAEIRLKDSNRLGDNAADFRIDGRVAPVLAVGNAKTLDVLLGSFDVVEVGCWNGIAVARVGSGNN